MAPSPDVTALQTFTFEDNTLKPNWEKFKKGWFDAKRQATRQETKYKLLMVNAGYDVQAAEGTETQRQMQGRL